MCKSVWGRLTQRTVTDANKKKLVECNWQLAHDQLTFSLPEAPNMVASLPETDEQSRIASYQEFIEASVPKAKGETAEQTQQREDKWKSMHAKFTQPGQPGSKFKNQFEKLLKSLALPKGAKEELGITGDEGMGPLVVEPPSNNAE